jgi:hypothetical protein
MTSAGSAARAPSEFRVSRSSAVMSSPMPPWSSRVASATARQAAVIPTKDAPTAFPASSTTPQGSWRSCRWRAVRCRHAHGVPGRLAPGLPRQFQLYEAPVLSGSGIGFANSFATLAERAVPNAAR